MACINYPQTCPAEGDQSVNLLGKILQVLNEGGGGGAGVASLSVNGGPAMTGAVGITIPAAGVQSVNGDAGPAVLLDTGDIPENGNLYYTQARFNTAFAAKSTTDLAEGTQLYFTVARVRATDLTGFASALGAITAADSVLSAFGKTQGRLAALEAGTAGPFLLRAGDTGTGPFVFTPAAANAVPLTLNQTLSGVSTSQALTINTTWGSTGAPTAFFLNATDTGPAAAAALLFDFQLGASSLFNLRKDGRLVLNGRAAFITTDVLGHAFRLTDTNTAAPEPVLTIAHNTTTAGASGIGAIFDWNLHSTTTSDTRASRWTVLWTDATHATRTSTTSFTNFTSGTESIQLLLGAGQVQGNNGTAALPAFTTRNDTDTGEWFPAANTIAWSLNAAEKMRLDSTGLGINITPITELTVASTSAADPRGIMSAQYSADTVGARIHLRKSRGATAGTNTAIVIGDVLGRIQFSGYSGSSYIQTAGIRAVSTGTLAATRLASSLILSTGTDAAPTVLTDWWTLNNAGDVIHSGAVSKQYYMQSTGGGGSAALRLDRSAVTSNARVRLDTVAVENWNFGLIGSGASVNTAFSVVEGAADVGTARMVIQTGGNTTFASDIFELRRTAVAQISRIYETADAGVTVPTNYSRLSLQTQAGNHLIRTEAAGTGLTAGQPRILQVGTGPSVGTDIAGQSRIVHSGQSTGTGVRGAILFQQSTPAGGTGSGVNALATTWQINTIGSLAGGAGFAFSTASGTNQRAGNAVLVAGTVTVANTSVTANTVVMLTRKTSGGTIGTAITYTVSAATSFTVTSDSALDTSTFSYFLIEVP